MRFKLLKNKSVFILGLVIGILLFQSIFMQSWIMSEGGLDIENGEAKVLAPKYNLALHYPLLSMTGFMTIATVPGAILKDCEKIFQ